MHFETLVASLILSVLLLKSYNLIGRFVRHVMLYNALLPSYIISFLEAILL